MRRDRIRSRRLLASPQLDLLVERVAVAPDNAKSRDLVIAALARLLLEAAAAANGSEVDDDAP
jgi:hypothetical protein